jgi:hypothetical protein
MFLLICVAQIADNTFKNILEITNALVQFIIMMRNVIILCINMLFCNFNRFGAVVLFIRVQLRSGSVNLFVFYSLFNGLAPDSNAIMVMQ